MVVKQTLGSRTFVVRVSDKNIIDGVRQWMPYHADAPTEAELNLLRVLICSCTEIDEEHEPLISLHWLRNEFVRLRKAGLAKTKSKSRNLTPSMFGECGASN